MVHIINGNVDILVVVETKLDQTFPENQFRINGFKKPYRRDRTANGGGIMIFVREDIPSLEKKNHTLPHNVEAIFVEINLRKSKFLLIGTYHSTNKDYGTSDAIFLNGIGDAMDVYTCYDKYLIAGDLNINIGEEILEDFMDEIHAKNLVKVPTCYKSTENPSCIDLFLTDGNRSFMKTMAIWTGQSDFHKMIVTVMRSTFPKTKPKTIMYRDFSKYDKTAFGNELRQKLQNQLMTYEKFDDIFLETLEVHAPQKTKVIRANSKPYVTKEMRKAIMLRTQLQNKMFKYNTIEHQIAFRHQRNYCNRLNKREKKNYYRNLNINEITDNKKFWNTMKPLFGDKGGARDNIILVEGEKIICEDKEVAQTFNDFFDNAVKSLGITENEMLVNKTGRNQGKVIDALKRYESHPSVLKIREKVGLVDTTFSFSLCTISDIESEIKALNPKKGKPHMSIPPKQLKDVKDIVSEALLEIWNKEIIGNKKFPSKLKWADMTPIFKKLETVEKGNYRPVAVVSKIFERIMDKHGQSDLNPWALQTRLG